MIICDDCVKKPSCEHSFFINPIRCCHYEWDKKCRKTMKYCELWGEFNDYPDGCLYLKGEDDCVREVSII